MSATDVVYIALEAGFVYFLIHIVWEYSAHLTKGETRASDLSWVCSASRGLRICWNGGSLKWRKGDTSAVVYGAGCTIITPRTKSGPTRILIKTRDSVMHTLEYHLGKCRYIAV